MFKRFLGFMDAMDNRFGLIHAMYWDFVAVFYVYIVPILNLRSFSGVEIGILTAILTCSSILGQLALGYLADKTRRNRLITIVSCVASFVMFTLFYCTSGMSAAALTLFGVGLFKAPAMSVLDSLIIKTFNGDTTHYGRARCWGSISYAVLMLFYGALLDRFGMGLTVYAGAFFLILLVWALMRVPELPKLTAEELPRERKEKNTMRITPAFLLILTVYFVMGIGTQPVYSFIALTLEEAGGTTKLLGILYFANSAAEFFFIRGSRPLERFGAYGQLYISIGLYALTTFVISISRSPLPILLMMTLNGAAYGILVYNSRRIIADMIPEKDQSKANSWLDMLYFGLGAVVGNVLIGGLIDRAGCLTAMMVFAAVQAAALIPARLAQTRKGNA